MAEKEKQSEHKSTIDKYFSRTADGFKAWAEEDEEGRNYMQVAAETTGDTDENGKQRIRFSYFLPLQDRNPRKRTCSSNGKG